MTHQKTAKIMIVEDEVLTAVDLEGVLMDLGHTVVGMAPTRERAVQVAERTRPDLVLMDINLENSTGDGIDAAGDIRERFGIPVIFITAYADQEVLSRAQQVLPWAYLLKPFVERELAAAIQMTLAHADWQRERTRLLQRLEAQVAELQAQEQLMRGQLECETADEAARVAESAIADVVMPVQVQIYLTDAGGAIRASRPPTDGRQELPAAVLQLQQAAGEDAEDRDWAVDEVGAAKAVAYRERLLAILYLQPRAQAAALDPELLGRLAREAGLLLSAQRLRDAAADEDLDLDRLEGLLH